MTVQNTLPGRVKLKSFPKGSLDVALGLPFELFIWASLIYRLKSQEKRYFGLFEGHFTVFCSALGIPNRKHFLLGREDMWRALAVQQNVQPIRI